MQVQLLEVNLPTLWYEIMFILVKNYITAHKTNSWKELFAVASGWFVILF